MTAWARAVFQQLMQSLLADRIANPQWYWPTPNHVLRVKRTHTLSTRTNTHTHTHRQSVASREHKLRALQVVCVCLCVCVCAFACVFLYV